MNCRSSRADSASIVAVDILHGVATTGFCPAGVGYARDRHFDARDERIRVLRISGRRVVGHHVRAHDGGIEGRLALRDMAVGALRVVRLESAGVVGAGGEIDVVVAGAAGRPARRCHKGFGLRGAGGLAVANFAAAGIGGIDDRGKVVDGIHVAGNLVRTPGVVEVPTTLGNWDPMWILCAITLRSSELPVTGSAFCGWWQSTHISMPCAWPPWKANWSWQVLQLWRADDIARDGNRRAIGNEVEGGAGVVGTQIECCEIAVAVDRDGGGHGGVKSRRGLAVKVY